MLKKLKKRMLAEPGPTGAIPTQNTTLPPPPSHASGELPEIRPQAEELSNLYDPVTPPICMTCGPLKACTEQPARKTDLLRSTENGCSICSLLWEACVQSTDIDGVDYVSTWTGRGGVFGLYLGRDGLETIDGGGGTPGQAIKVMFLASTGERTRSPFPWLPIVGKSPFNRTQLRDTQMLSSWVNDCQANHPHCQQIMNPKLPTRVIDVGSDTVQPFLKITHNEAGRYLALSHRWGTPDSKRKMLITKGETIEHFCQEIPFDSFPLTFKNAIEVSRSLGIQYLWIDSLCIIQDSIHDWEIEATRMGDIYENAYATLFAERAGHCDDGLFQTAEDRSIQKDWVREIDYRDPQTNEQHRVLVSWPSYYPNSLEEAFCLVEKPTSHLQNRGWVMQEEILSRRKICFSMTELHWQCKSMSQCECGLRSWVDTQVGDDFIRNTLLRRRDDGSVTRGLSASDSRRTRTTRDTNKEWKNLVEIYSHRVFTDERDRLPALAGAASKLGRPSQNYLAGIWREDADDQLLWHGSNRESSPCRRHEPYYAPTWSWASLRGNIIFSSFRFCTQIWRIIEGSCQPSGENPMGLVSTGMLRIRSKVASVFVEECEGKAANLEHSEAFGIFRQHGIYEQIRDGKTYHLVLRADTDAGKETKFVSNDTIVFLDTEDDWKLFAGKPAQRYYYLIAQAGSNKGRNTVYSEKFSRTMGLLIRESAVKKGHWERICLLAPQGWRGDWCCIAEDREILLI